MSEVLSSLNISWFRLSGINFVCEFTPTVRQNNLRSSASTWRFRRAAIAFSPVNSGVFVL